MWDSGSWHSSDVRFAPRLGGVISGCLKHLQFSIVINHFLGVMVFYMFFGSTFPICLMTLCTSIPTIVFLGFSTWEIHSHFIKVRYMTRGPIGRSIVCSSSLSHSLLYNNSPPWLCFHFIGGWYAYSRFCIRCGFCFLMITTWVFIIKAFNAANEMCSLISTRVGLLYVISS